MRAHTRKPNNFHTIYPTAKLSFRFLIYALVIPSEESWQAPWGRDIHRLALVFLFLVSLIFTCMGLHRTSHGGFLVFLLMLITPSLYSFIVFLFYCFPHYIYIPLCWKRVAVIFCFYEFKATSVAPATTSMFCPFDMVDCTCLRTTVASPFLNRPRINLIIITQQRPPTSPPANLAMVEASKSLHFGRISNTLN